MKRGSLIFLFLFLFIWTGVFRVRAEDFEIVVGEIFSVEAVGVKKVFIRNPRVLDVEGVYSDRVEFIGKAKGYTEVEIEKEDGTKTEFTVLVLTINLEDLRDRLEELISTKLGIENVSFKIDKLNSKVILEGEVTKEELEKINKSIESFSSNIQNFLKIKEVRDLVQIDCQVLELTRDFQKTLGVDWVSAIYVTEAEPPSAGSLGDIFKIKDKFTRSKGESGTTPLSWKINFLLQSGKGRVLSQPKIVCLSGEEATISLGGEVPIVTEVASDLAITTSVEFKSYGVNMQISPVVLEDDLVKINLNVSVSDVKSEVKVGSLSYPVMGTNSATTQLLLRSGETVFIAGLIKQNENNSVNKFPWLADLPVLGPLFRSRDFLRSQTELVITLTPRIIRYGQEAKLKELARSYKPTGWKKEEPVSTALAKYIRNIQERISEALIYPEGAKEAGLEAELKLSLHLSRKGDLLNVRIVKSSGYSLLDKAAIRIVKELSPYKPFPSQITEKELWIDIPVKYKMD